MDSSLRPRDIQARIRAGEAPETVAQAAGATVEKVMVYAGPVLAERAHVADRAQQSSVRRRSGSGEPSLRTLGEAVAHRLRACNASPDRVEWDSARREDGRWRLTAGFALAERTGRGTFLYDPPGNYVVPDDDDARWLVGDLPGPGETSHEQPGGPRRRLSAVPTDEELPLGDDAIGLVTSEQASPESTGTGGPAAGDVATEQEDLPGGGPAGSTTTGDAGTRGAGGAGDGFFDEVLQDPDEVPTSGDLPAVEEPRSASAHGHDRAPAAEESPDTAAEGEPGEDEESGEETRKPPRRPVRKSRGRASVPSWDEIMFGNGRSDS